MADDTDDDVKVKGAKDTMVSTKEPQATVLLRLASAAAVLFHAPDREAYADVTLDGIRQTWPVRSRSFRQWLSREFYRATGGAANSEATASALGILEAQAMHDGPEREVFVRIGTMARKIYLDLSDREWRAVEIDPAGWRVVSAPPVRFRRSKGMEPLLAPVPGGSINALREFVNITDEHNFVLLVSWLLVVLGGSGPFPCLVLLGQAGSAKSFLGGLLRSLTDPAAPMLRSLPREEHDLFISARNGYVLDIDNISSLLVWLSDALCRLCTGGGFATRQLYSDADEMLINAMRPILLTGIEDFVVRGDLADRALFLLLEPITTGRKTERELQAKFKKAQPGILDALLDAVSHGLKHLPTTTVDPLPRMADFALWVTACEGALWPHGTFMAAYNANRDSVNETIVESDQVALAVRNLIHAEGHWTGTATDLLERLSGTPQSRVKGWPVAPHALSGRLRRAAPNLRQTGISIEFSITGRDRDKQRVISISTTTAESREQRASPLYPASPKAEIPFEDECLGGNVSVSSKQKKRTLERSRLHGNGERNASKPDTAPKRTRKTNSVNAGNSGNGSAPLSSNGAAKPELGLDAAIIEWDQTHRDPVRSIASIAKKFGQQPSLVRELLGRRR